MANCSEIGSINSVLGDKNAPWNQIVNALNQLQDLCSRSSDFLDRQQDCINLRFGLLALLKDNRSKVVFSVCDTINLMACKLSNGFESIGYHLLPECLDKSASHVCGTKMQECCKNIVTNVVMKRSIPSILSAIDKKSEKVAHVAIECLEIVLTKWPETIILDYKDPIVGSLIKGIQNPYQFVRRTVDILIPLCIRQFPAMYQRFREKLPSDRLALFTPPRQLSSYYDGAVNYYLGQTVMCHLNTGNYVGVIKYIGNPESKGIRFGILFSQYTKSQFSGSINGIQLFHCSPGYGALVIPSQVTPTDDKSVLQRPKQEQPKEDPGSPLMSPLLDHLNYPTSPGFLRRDYNAVDDCLATHKLVLLNFLQDIKGELLLLEEVEKLKTDPEALRAYQQDMFHILEKRQQEESDLLSKLSKLSV